MEENEKKEEVITSQDQSTRSLPNLQEMILEYAWTHNMKDLHAGWHLLTQHLLSVSYLLTNTFILCVTSLYTSGLT